MVDGTVGLAGFTTFSDLLQALFHEFIIRLDCQANS